MAELRIAEIGRLAMLVGAGRSRDLAELRRAGRRDMLLEVRLRGAAALRGDEAFDNLQRALLELLRRRVGRQLDRQLAISWAVSWTVSWPSVGLSVGPSVDNQLGRQLGRQ